LIISKGNFKTARNTQTKEVLAIKIVEISEDCKLLFERETMALTALNHPNIISTLRHAHSIDDASTSWNDDCNTERLYFFLFLNVTELHHVALVREKKKDVEKLKSYLIMDYAEGGDLFSLMGMLLATPVNFFWKNN